MRMVRVVRVESSTHRFWQTRGEGTWCATGRQRVAAGHAGERSRKPAMMISGGVGSLRRLRPATPVPGNSNGAWGIPRMLRAPENTYL